MKKTKLLYWIFTGLFAALMIFSSIPDILNNPEAIKFLALLGYPAYFAVFIGVAKLLGVAGILVPGYPRIKEWAYAGLVFDLVGALYSQIATMPQAGGIIFMLLCIALAFTSYFFYHKRLRESTATTA